MSGQDIILSSLEVPNGDQLEDEIIDSIVDASFPISPLQFVTRINRVPRMVRDTGDYEIYYVPKVVSIGPYHFGDPKLEVFQRLKPKWTMDLLKNNKEALKSLYKKINEMVEELREYYEKDSTTKFSDVEFTKMMLLDACFILYFIPYFFGESSKIIYLLIKGNDFFNIRQDLLLLENQIPFRVLQEVMKFVKIDWDEMFNKFIYSIILGSGKSKRNKLKQVQNVKLTGDNGPNHLLHLLHRTLTKKDVEVLSRHPIDWNPNYRWTSRNVNKLVEVGIHFKPSDTMSLAHIEFSKGWSLFSADLELPPITVDDSTKPMFLNLIAYEMCSEDDVHAWVTSYVCLLDSLIGHPEDVEVLRKAGVLEDCFGRDQEVVKLFKEIATGLVPDNFTYVEVKYLIQRHYERWGYTLFSQIRHLYLNDPGLFFTYFGVIAIFLSVVQTYFTIWSPKTTCDDLCMFLKKNHHL